MYKICNSIVVKGTSILLISLFEGLCQKSSLVTNLSALYQCTSIEQDSVYHDSN